MKVKDLQKQLDNWDKDAEITLYKNDRFSGVAIWPPNESVEPEHVIEVPSSL